MIDLIRTKSEHTDFLNLVRLLDQDLLLRNGATQNVFYAQFNKVDKIKHAIVAYQDGFPAGCGAFKEYERGVIEIKRMFVKPEYRGKGIAQEILKELEVWASELKYQNCILETGKKQPEAIRLYQKSGYEFIPNFGQYIGVDDSICMKKALV